MDSNRLADKLDKIDSHLSSIDLTLARQNATLEEHVKRTNLLETKLAPVEKHVAAVNGGLKVIGFSTVLFEVLRLVGVLK